MMNKFGSKWYNKSCKTGQYCKLSTVQYNKLCTLLLKWERLRRWVISVEDKQQRLNLGSLGRVHRAEVQYRVGMGCYEGMAWEHLLMQLTQGRDTTHQVAIKSQENIFWEVVMQQQQVGKSVILPQMMALSTHLFVAWKEKKKRRIQKTVPG